MLKIRNYWDNGKSLLSKSIKDLSEIICECETEYGIFSVYISSYFVPSEEIGLESILVDGRASSKFWVDSCDLHQMRWNLSSPIPPFLGEIKRNLVEKNKVFSIKDILEEGCRQSIEKYIGKALSEMQDDTEPTEYDLMMMEQDYMCYEYC